MVEQQSVRDPTEDVPDGGRGDSIVRLCNVCTQRAGADIFLPERKFSNKGKKIGRCQDCADRVVQVNIARGQRQRAIAKRERREVAAARAESLRHERRRRLVAVCQSLSASSRCVRRPCPHLCQYCQSQHHYLRRSASFATINAVAST